MGKSSFGRCRRLLNPHGVFLWTDLGPGGQNPVLALVTPWLPGRSVLFGFPHHDQAMVNGFKDLLESGQFRPVIDRSYPLAEIVDAYRYVETGQKIGNVVITVEPPDYRADNPASDRRRMTNMASETTVPACGKDNHDCRADGRDGAVGRRDG